MSSACTLVLSERSRGTVGRAELALLRPRGYLVNTSRAGLIDTAVLVEALRTGTIAAHALRAFAEGAPVHVLAAPQGRSPA